MKNDLVNTFYEIKPGWRPLTIRQGPECLLGYPKWELPDATRPLFQPD